VQWVFYNLTLYSSKCKMNNHWKTKVKFCSFWTFLSNSVYKTEHFFENLVFLGYMVKYYSVYVVNLKAFFFYNSMLVLTQKLIIIKYDINNIKYMYNIQY